LSQAFRPREYVIARSEAEASELLVKGGEKARVIAGGTGIYEVAHRGLLGEIETLVDISRLNLNYVRLEDGSLRLGSCVTMSSILETTEISSNRELQAILDALHAIQPIQVKNVATVGGAICTALPFFDLPASLIALDAQVVLAPTDRTLKLEDFIQGYFSVNLLPGEFVREIRVPVSNNEVVGSSFLKFALTADDWAIINCAMWLKLDEKQGVINSARLCFGGGVGEKQKRAVRVERSLIGLNPTNEDVIKEILDRSLHEDLDTISDLRASSKFRMHIANVLAKRAIVRSARVASS
jgi:CO/xanthine dehydrogenase FAD-binding subunit